MSHNCLSGIGIYRRFHRPPLTLRDAKIAHIILSEVAWFHEQGRLWKSVLQVPRLSARCRMAPNLLVEGLSRKEIAKEMNVFVHTVIDHVKQIYDFYQVHSHTGADKSRQYFAFSAPTLPRRTIVVLRY